MSPKQKALIETLKLFAAALLIGVMVNAAFTYFTLAQIGIGWGVALLAFLGKMIYDLELSKAEHLQSLEKLNDTK
jgi:fatty acid desaturase